MLAKSFNALLVFLVLSVQADDIAAAATPDPDDDVLAAQDNDFRCPRHPGESQRQSLDLIVLPAASPSQ